MDQRLATLVAIAAGLTLGSAIAWVSVLFIEHKANAPLILPLRLQLQSQLPVDADQLGQMVFLLHPRTQKALCTRHAESVDWYTRHGFCRVSLSCWLDAQHIELPITYP